MSKKLKPCPFCGGKARIREVSIGDSYDGFTVECENCAVDIGNIDTKEEAIKAWNKRPNPWHTGTPSEEGLYWTTVKVDNCYAYEPVHWKNKWCFRHFDKPIVAWQKIEPYEASEERE